MQFFVAYFLLAHSPYFTVHAFLPRINVAEEKSETKDHTLITRNGLLKTVIYFFFDNPQYLKDESLTDFLNGVLSELGEEPTAGKDAMNTISSQIKFINAMNAIQSANVEVDSLNRKAEEHFDGEQFQQGAKRLIRLRQELITSLLKGDKFTHSRNLAGYALHTLQDFYSRSNWIELGNSVPFDALGQPGSEISEEFVAGPNEVTCTGCLSDLDRNDKCGTNLITGKLTSGYRSGQDVRKPVNGGKCSHGGKTDDSRFQPATGGINKDSTSIKESPHASLHKVAADLAVEATYLFLKEVRSTVGDDNFARFLNLKSDKSMALVIDVSGSMRDEIEEVKNISIKFVRDTLEMKGASFTYVLVPFNDPEVGPVTVTNNAQQVINAVRNLRANGGGDCPELGMTGLYQALLHCLPESEIYYFSDADAKDFERENEVMSLAKNKKVKISFILTGQCGRRRRRRDLSQSGIQNSAIVPKKIRRVRRNAQGQALYQALATETGGQVLETSKAQVADVVKVIDPTSSSNSSADLQDVGLLNVKESSAQYFSEVVYIVDIDSTLESLVLILTAAGSPDLQVTGVEGNSRMQEQIISNSTKLLIKEFTSLTSGSLKLTVSCQGPYSLQVTGSSPIDFTYQLLDVEDEELGNTRRVLGNPLRGQTLLLTLDFVGQEIDEVTNLTLVGINGTGLETFNITQGEGFYQDFYYVKFIPSADRFRLKVTGFDTTGARFQRMKPTLFTLGDVKLSQNVDSSNGSNAIFPGESLELKISVTNTGDQQQLYFNATDDLNFLSKINPSQGSSGRNNSLVLRVSLAAPSDAKYGVTSTVTVFAFQDSRFTQLVNFMVLFVTVASKAPDLSSPSCNITSQSGSCAGVYGRPECVSSTWVAQVTFNDSGEGLLSITSRENRNGTLNVAAFNQGAANTPISASFTSNCCHPKVIFVGVDLVGNMGICSVSLVPDIVSFRASPNTSAVTLHPGQTTKVPFTLVNLGSKGFFVFHVSKTPSLISYVIPFSLALKTNASTSGHVVIASRGNISEVQTISVKAVAQSDSVNDKEVKLFDLKVLVTPQRQGITSTPATSTAALKYIQLRANVPTYELSLETGESLKFNFTVMNLAAAETFSFDVLTSQPRITGNTEPSRTFLDHQQTSSFLLILSSQSNTPLGIVTQVNVTATPSSHNAEVKELVVFSLNVKIDRNPSSKDKESGEKSPDKDDEMEKWHIFLIFGMATLAILLITFLVIFGVSRGYCRGGRPQNPTVNNANINLGHEPDDVIANTYT